MLILLSFAVLWSTTAWAAPVLTGLAPGSGPASGETLVLLTGSGFSATDSVVLSGSGLTSPPGDICADSNPVCASGTCVLNGARSPCTINGVPGMIPFVFAGANRIDLFTPNVGSFRGTVAVVVRDSNSINSQPASYEFRGTILAPIIDFVDPLGFIGDSCCEQGWQLLILGRNFRRCSSVIFSTPDGIFEVLPTPDLSDCGIRHGSPAEPSVRERLELILPPDGMTIDCASRPDLVPLNSIGARIYEHDSICRPPLAQPFAVGRTATLVSTPPDDFINGGAYGWISDSQMRVYFGPRVLPACGDSYPLTVLVSNDPGSSGGDAISNAMTVSFTNTAVEAIPGDQGNALRARQVANDVELEFSRATAGIVRVTRDGDKTALGMTALVPDITARTFRDAGALAGPDAYYRIKGASPCSGIAGP